MSLLRIYYLQQFPCKPVISLQPVVSLQNCIGPGFRRFAPTCHLCFPPDHLGKPPAYLYICATFFILGPVATRKQPASPPLLTNGVAYYQYPPLCVEVIWEFQEFQEFRTTQSNFKRRKRVAKIKRRKMFDRRAFILFRTQSPHAQ